MHRLISDPRDESKTIVPTLPLLLVFPDGMVVENDSVEDVITVMTTKDYLKLNNEEKCLKRIKLARNHSMYALQYDLDAVVTLKGEIVKNNYAADDGDEDYYYSDEELKKAEKIIVDNDRDLLLSLIKIGTIRVLEKVGSTIFLEKPEKIPEGNVYTDVATIFQAN